MAIVDITSAESVDFTGKVVLVTGGSSGIGLSMVQKFTEKGAKVIIADLKTPPSSHAEHEFISVDVSNWASQVNMFNKAIEKFGKLDVICVNAGITTATDPFANKVDDSGDLVEPNWSVINLNLIGSLSTIKLGIYHLKQTGGGSIILTTSMTGYDAHGSPTYAASKHGMLGAMRGLRDYVGKVNVTLNSLAPGFTETNLFQASGGAFTFSQVKQAGAGYQGPEAVALAALYLASRPDLNGKSLSIVGGKYLELEDDLRTALRKVTAATGSTGNAELAARGGPAYQAIEEACQVLL